MNRRWLLGGLLIAGGVGMVAVATRRPRVGPTTRLLVIGDSLALGLVPHLRELAAETGVEAFSGKGLVGSRLDQWAASDWLEAELADFAPTLVLVSLGTNDEAMGPGAAERQAPALVMLLEKLHATGAEIVWIGPPELPFARAGVADMIRDMAPFYFDSERVEIPRAPDNLHPTASGYAGWAGVLWHWLS